MGLDADGDAVLAWMRHDGTSFRVQQRSRSSAGVLGPVTTLSAPGTTQNPDLAVDDAGNAVVAWTRWDSSGTSRIQAATRSAAGVWAPAVTLSPAGGPAEFAQVAIDDDGDAIVAWQRFDGTAQKVQFRTRPAGGAWSPARTASRAVGHGREPDVAVDADGDALLVWQAEDTGLTVSKVEGRALSAAGTLGLIQPVSGTGSHSPHVAITPAGRATVVYHQSTGDSQFAMGRVRNANGSWEAAKALSDSTGGIAVSPRVAAGAQAATAAWVRPDGDGDWRVEARPWVPFSWRPYTVLSADDASTDTFDIAMEQVGGEALAVWRQFDGDIVRVASSAGS